MSDPIEKVKFIMFVFKNSLIGGQKSHKVWDYIKENFTSNHRLMVRCGDANPNGNVALTYQGGCREELNIKDAYRCVGCGGYFHLDCILKHFELEKDHDVSRNALREILNTSKESNIRDIASKGMEPTKPITNLRSKND
jgi:hypothetical protein